MRTYSNKISLTKNSRGVYCLDTTIGCASGMANNKRGCYGDCYAAKSAKIYGYDFSKTVLREFENEKHKRKIVNQIRKINLDFVRIGSSGDPSENWAHTLKICKDIQHCNKQIVIITKHWTNLSDVQLLFLNTINACINTSVSALDHPMLLNNSLSQYNRIKPYCKSVLRIVSANFNESNNEGKRLAEIQRQLFKNQNTIDTVLRINKNNTYISDGILKVKSTMFLGQKSLVSKFNPKTYFGKCSSCQEMCGVNIGDYKNRIPIQEQQKLFERDGNKI